MPTDDPFDVSSVGMLFRCWKHSQVAALCLLRHSVLSCDAGMYLWNDSLHGLFLGLSNN